MYPKLSESLEEAKTNRKRAFVQDTFHSNKTSRFDFGEHEQEQEQEHHE